MLSGLFCGAKDEQGFGQVPVPGHGLDGVFGVVEESVEPVFSPDDSPVSNFGEAWNVVITGRPRYVVREALREEGECRPGTIVEGHRYTVALRAAPDARVVAEDEHRRLVAVFHRFGQHLLAVLNAEPRPQELAVLVPGRRLGARSTWSPTASTRWETDPTARA